MCSSTAIAGIGNDFFSVGTRVSRTFAVTERVQLEALAEAFNLLNHRNNLTLNGAFGVGRVSDQSLRHVRAGNGGERSAGGLQFGAANRGFNGG